MDDGALGDLIWKGFRGPFHHPTSAVYWCIASKLKVPLFLTEWPKRFCGWISLFNQLLLWWYYNDKKAYRILAALPFKMSPPLSPMEPGAGAWRPHHEQWAYTSNFVQCISGFWMNIDDEIMPQYVTLYDGQAIVSCVESWPGLMTKQNWYKKPFPQEFDYKLLNPK